MRNWSMLQRVSLPMYHRLAMYGLCLFLLLLCSGCRESAAPAAALAWPGGWPEPRLTVQPGMQQAELFASLGFDSDDGMTVQGKPGVGDFEGTLWAVGFATDEKFSTVLNYWESELRNAGYFAVENEVESESTRAAARQYVSPDKKMLIVVAHSETKSRETGRTRGVVKLSVCAEDIPLEQFLRRL
jgi:hypothetical protein